MLSTSYNTVVHYTELISYAMHLLLPC